MSEATAAVVAAVLSALGAWVAASARHARVRTRLGHDAEESERDAWRALWRSEVDRVVEQLVEVTHHRDELLSEVSRLTAQVEILTREVTELRDWRRQVEARTPTTSRAVDDWSSRRPHRDDERE